MAYLDTVLVHGKGLKVKEFIRLYFAGKKVLKISDKQSKHQTSWITQHVYISWFLVHRIVTRAQATTDYLVFNDELEFNVENETSDNQPYRCRVI